MGGGEGVNPVSFYIDGGEGGSDTENTGREKDRPFKTLAAAYGAALKESAPVRLVILSDIDVAAVEDVAAAPDEPEGEDEEVGEGALSEAPAEEPPEAPEPFSAIAEAKVIIIVGGGDGPVTLTRSGNDGDSVLEIGGGAQVTFTNIKIDGKKGTGDGGKDRRALKITGDAEGPKTKVTLGNGVTITGKITTSSNNAAPDDNDGSGILVGGNAELAMTGDSKVSLCETTATTSYAKGAVVVAEGGVFTMNGTANVSDNTATGTGIVRGGGVYASGGMFTMGGGAKISGNKVIGTGTGAVNGGGVYASGGMFTMGGSAEITCNEVTGTGIGVGGGGVYASDGTFTMGGNAEVSSNNVTSASAVLGGGISIKNGNVMMTGGTVSGNKAVSTTSSSGGGLAQSGGSFVMTGGTIYGRPADDNDLLGNTAVSGAAYYRSGTGGTATPELDSSIDTTITDGVAAEDTTSDDQ